MPDEEKTVYVPKQSCYHLEMAFKELPDEVKGMPLELEGAVSQQTQHYKTAYKAVHFDFFKKDGFGEGKDSAAIEESRKKQRKLI